MIKPEKLKRGDKIAIVSLSWGGMGNQAFLHKFYIAKERLENEFGTGLLPLGVKCEIDIDNKIIKLVESATQ